MKCVILDKDSIDRSDIDFTAVKKTCPSLIEYGETSAAQIRARIATADIVISNKVLINDAELSRAKSLKLICVPATGTNNVDLDSAKKHGIPVCNVTGYATSSVVQHVFGLILNLSRNLHRYHDAVREHRWQQAKHFCLLDYPIIDISGKTLGIIGYGELGKAVSKVAKSFGMNVIIAQSLTGKTHNDRIPLDELLQTADIISLHCPLTHESEHLINQTTLAKMKNTAFLINAARGGIVNEEDLWHAVHNGEIAGAAVDVLSTEPPRENILLDKPLPNLIVTPHIAWASQLSRQKLMDEIALNIRAFLNGEQRNRVV